MKKPNKLLLQFLLYTCLICAFTLVQAQDDEQNADVAVLWSVTAVDGKDAEFEAAVRGFHEFLADKEGHFNWQWYSVLTGENTGSYLARSGGHDWADMDVEHDWDDAVNVYFEENLSPLIESATRSITVGEDEVVNWPESLDDYNYFRVTNWQVKQGKGDEFDTNLKKIHEALQEGSWGGYYYFAYNNSGARSGSMALVTPHKNWADMAEIEPGFFSVISSVLGEEETVATLAALNETYKAGDVTTLRWRKDMNP